MNRLNEIEARANAATPGPWEAGCNDRHVLYVATENEEFCAEYGPELYDSQGFFSDDDTEFIAHARTDVPWLLEQVDRRDKALEKVLRLHPRVVVLHADPEFGRMEDDAICGACIVNHEPTDWPCPTVEAIRQHLGEDA